MTQDNVNPEQQFAQKMQQLIDNPNLPEIARLVVNLLTEQADQIQSNVISVVIMNSLIELLAQKNIFELEEFQELYAKNLDAADKQLAENFKKANESMQEEMLKEQEKSDEEES